MFPSFSSIFGLGIVIALVGYIYKRDAIHWEYVANGYKRNWATPIKECWGNAVLYGKFTASKSYNGILKIGIFPDGFAMRVMFPPKAIFCKPIFIPYRDILGWNQTWYINDETVELELKHAPEVKIVMPRSQVEWMKENAGAQLRLMNEPSPHKDKPVFWYWIIIAQGVMAVLLVIFLLYKYLTWPN